MENKIIKSLKNKWPNNFNKFKIFNGAQLKWIAMISMLIDHTNKGILWLYLEDNSSIWLQLLSDIFEILGRVAFPIFLFQLVEGFIHTKNFLKYVTRLFVFALISEVPYDMFESGEFWVPQSQNMFFTLTLALIVLWLIDKVKSRNSKLASRRIDWVKWD